MMLVPRKECLGKMNLWNWEFCLFFLVWEACPIFSPRMILIFLLWLFVPVRLYPLECYIPKAGDSGNLRVSFLFFSCWLWLWSKQLWVVTKGPLWGTCMSCMLTIRHEFCGLKSLVGKHRGPCGNWCWNLNWIQDVEGWIKWPGSFLGARQSSGADFPSVLCFGEGGPSREWASGACSFRSLDLGAFNSSFYDFDPHNPQKFWGF